MSAFSHIQLNVLELERSCRFYLDVLKPIGFREADSKIGRFVRITNNTDAVIVLCPVEERFRHLSYHRKAVGLGHLAISVPSRTEVDIMEAHLRSLDIPILGEGKLETNYRKGYYSLFFEDHDRILLEIVCHDPFYFSALPDETG